MRKDGHRNLSRRERQIMDILYQRGRATGRGNPPGDARRAHLLGGPRQAPRAGGEGPRAPRGRALRYVYLPTVARDMARNVGARHMVSTFFAGSVEDTVAALLDLSVGQSRQRKTWTASPK